MYLVKIWISLFQGFKRVNGRILILLPLWSLVSCTISFPQFEFLKRGGLTSDQAIRWLWITDSETLEVIPVQVGGLSIFQTDNGAAIVFDGWDILSIVPTIDSVPLVVRTEGSRRFTEIGAESST